MPFDAPMADVMLKGLTGLCWSAVYVLIIRQALRDGFVGLPLACVWANTAWELTYSLITPDPSLQRYVNAAWLVLDAIILIQAWRCRRTYRPFIQRHFITLTIAAIIAATLVIQVFGHALDDVRGTYSSYVLNTMMSFLFIQMALHYGRRGQSPAIAFLKMLGTLAPTYLCYITFEDAHVLHTMGVAIFVMDIIYLVLLLSRTGTAAYPPIDGSHGRTNSSFSTK